MCSTKVNNLMATGMMIALGAGLPPEAIPEVHRSTKPRSIRIITNSLTREIEAWNEAVEAQKAEKKKQRAQKDATK